ncbi:hypothetical protein MTO96_000842 [Rhipicephalus appendiculatus]
MLNHMLTFAATTMHNNVITSVFDALVDTIEAEVSAIPHVVNDSEARRLLRKLRLVLPYHVYPMDTPIPELNANFFRNLLLVRQYRLVYDRYEPPGDILFDLVQHVEDFYPVNFKKFICVPMPMYTSLALHSKSSIQAVAIFGVMIADAIWSAVMKSSVWHRGPCKDKQDSTSDDDSELIMRWPRRAFASSIRALRTPSWNEDVLWGAMAYVL